VFGLPCLGLLSLGFPSPGDEPPVSAESRPAGSACDDEYTRLAALSEETLRDIEKRRGALSVEELEAENSAQSGGPVTRNMRVRANYDPKSYTFELPQTVVSNQMKTGNCAIHATCNILRNWLLANGAVKPDFEFSQSYLYFFSQFEKENALLVDYLKKWR